MTLPTDYVDGDVLTAADVNAITTAVNAISPAFIKFAKTTDITTRLSTSVNFTDSGVSLSYTPINASNTLIISAHFVGGWNGTDVNDATKEVYFELYDSSAAAQIVQTRLSYVTEAPSDDPYQFLTPVAMVGTTTANSTSARTYKIRYKSAVANSGSVAMNNAEGTCYLTVSEVAP